MKIGAIFSDYDGTLAREDLQLEESKLPRPLEEILERIASSVPVCILTSKDLHFVQSRTSFATAWACVGGLEIVLARGEAIREGGIGNVKDALEFVKRIDTSGVAIELKRSVTGELLGFSIDWRYGPKPSQQFIQSVSTELTKRGLVVAHDGAQPFIDVFGATPNKGRALAKLKELLDIRGGTMFIGDSHDDNLAFDEADVGIGVKHGQALENLTCKYVVDFSELPGMLTRLAQNDMAFDAAIPSRKRELAWLA
ncbi:MAG: hypothetical protein OK422_02125 [Thaumarchaeota archaeon]|nr:hypothetical protein [Nitrososphaerota archaeon]